MAILLDALLLVGGAVFGWGLFVAGLIFVQFYLLLLAILESSATD